MRKIYVLNFSLGVRVTRNPNSLTSLVKSLTKSQGMVVIDLSRIPVNKCTNSRLGWTKYRDLTKKFGFIFIARTFMQSIEYLLISKMAS